MQSLLADTMQQHGLTLPEAVVYLSCDNILPRDVLATHASFDAMRSNEQVDIGKIRDTALGNSISKVYQCRKCFSNNISVRNVQMRAGDEGQTEIRTCQQCGTVTHVNS